MTSVQCWLAKCLWTTRLRNINHQNIHFEGTKYTVFFFFKPKNIPGSYDARMPVILSQDTAGQHISDYCLMILVNSNCFLAAATSETDTLWNQQDNGWGILPNHVFNLLRRTPAFHCCLLDNFMMPKRSILLLVLAVTHRFSNHRPHVQLVCFL